MDAFEIHIKCPDGSFQKLALPPDYSNNFQQQSPLFNSENVPGTFTLPVTCPTLGNSKKLGFPERLDFNTKPTYVDARIYIEGILFSCGKLKVQKANCSRFQKQFFDNKGEFTRLYANQNISECLDIDFNTGCLDFNNCRIFEIGNEAGAGIIKGTLNGILTSGITWGFGVTFNDALVTFMNDVNSNPVYEMTVTRSGNTLVFCSTVENSIPSVSIDPLSNGVTFTEITTNGIDESNQCMIDYLNNYMQNPHPSHVFPSYYNANAYDGENPDWSGFVNAYSQGTYLGNTNQNGERAKYSWSPFISWKYILEQISEKTGYQIKGELIDDPCFSKAYFFSNCMLDTTAIASNGDTALVPIDSYNLKDCLPEMSIAEYLDEVATMFCAYTCFDPISKCIEFKFHKDIFKQNPIKGNQYVVCGEGDICYQLEDGFTLSYKKPSNDKKWDEEDGILDSLTIGDGGTPIETIISPMYAVNTSYSNSISYRMPCINTVGATESFDVGQNDLDPKVVLYHGFQQNLSGDIYPFASYNDLLHDGTPVDPDNRCDLSWEGEYGMYQQYFKQWLTSQAEGASIPIDFNIDAKFLLQHKCGNVYWFTVNGVSGCFVLQNLPVSVNQCGLKKSKGTLFYLGSQRIIDTECLLVSPDFSLIDLGNETLNIALNNWMEYDTVAWLRPDNTWNFDTIKNTSNPSEETCVFRLEKCEKYYYFQIVFNSPTDFEITQIDAP